MTRLLAIGTVALSLLGATAASAQVFVPSDPGVSAPQPYGYSSDGPYVYGGGPDGYYGQGYGTMNPSYGYNGALSGQCSTDEGYGRRGSCETSGN